MRGAGEVAEWSNAPDSKSGIRFYRIEGSNPSLSATGSFNPGLAGFLFQDQCFRESLPGSPAMRVDLLAGALGHDFHHDVGQSEQGGLRFGMVIVMVLTKERDRLPGMMQHLPVKRTRAFLPSHTDQRFLYRPRQSQR